MSKLTNLIKAHPLAAVGVVVVVVAVAVFAFPRFFGWAKTVAAKVPGAQPAA